MKNEKRTLVGIAYYGQEWWDVDDKNGTRLSEVVADVCRAESMTFSTKGGPEIRVTVELVSNRKKHR